MKKKYRVLHTMTTVEGTLYEKELVTFENKEADGDWRVKDSMGRIWFLRLSTHRLREWCHRLPGGR